jgi:hypothetical protein
MGFCERPRQVPHMVPDSQVPDLSPGMSGHLLPNCRLGNSTDAVRLAS